MSNYQMSLHPLDDVNIDLAANYVQNYENMSADERRYVAEYFAVNLPENSNVDSCAMVLSQLSAIHITQLNARFKDMNASRRYDNPVEMIREESKRRDNKKVWLTGNVAEAHERIKQLDSEIVSEETPAQMLKTTFWLLLFGLGFLALAIYCTKTGAAINALAWILDSTWFVLLLTFVTLGLSLFFGFFSIGVLIIGGFLLIAWILFKLPGLSAFIVNGLLFLIAGILLLCVVYYVYSIITYKPLSEEEHEKNQARIAEKENLRRELTEYSEAVIKSLDIMKKQFMDHEKEFSAAICKYIDGNIDTGAIFEIFSFLNKYYSKVRK